MFINSVYLAGLVCVIVTGIFYVLMCTSSRSGPNYFLTSYLGPRTLTLVKRLPCGERLIDWSCRAFDYFFWQRNPLLQMFFVGLLAAGYSVAVWEVFPRIPNIYLAEYHRYTFSAVFLATLHSFYLACSTSPGYITEANLSKYDRYEYDKMMYVRKKCRTTGIIKPARSKYCTIMKRNVARFDHYCGWVAQPVGEENYRYFLLFLVMTSVLLMYSFVGVLLTLLSIVQKQGVWTAVFINRNTGKRHKATNMMILQWTITNFNTTVGIGLLTGVMGIVVFGFFSYHLYLAARNTTTNESFKWGEYKDLLGEAKSIIAEGRRRVEEAKEQGDDKKADLSDLPQIPQRFLDVLATHKDISDVRYFYNLGSIWLNLKEVLSPRSLRRPLVPSRKPVATAKTSAGKKEAGGRKKKAELQPRRRKGKGGNK